MGHNNREKEIKLLVKGSESLAEVNSVLNDNFRSRSTHVIRNASRDTFWETKNKGIHADFLRLRDMPEGLDEEGVYHKASYQVSLKWSDKGNNFDRVEIDLGVDDPDKATLIFNILLGAKPKGEIWKEYIVYCLDKKGTTVSVYQIIGDVRVFIEVEARDKKTVYSLVKEVKKLFPDNELERQTNSLYSMFLDNKNLEPVSTGKKKAKKRASKQ